MTSQSSFLYMSSRCRQAGFCLLEKKLACASDGKQPAQQTLVVGSQWKGQASSPYIDHQPTQPRKTQLPTNFSVALSEISTDFKDQQTLEKTPIVQKKINWGKQKEFRGKDEITDILRVKREDIASMKQKQKAL